MRGQPARLLSREREPARARETGAGAGAGEKHYNLHGEEARGRIATSALLTGRPLIGRAPAIAASDWLTPDSVTRGRPVTCSPARGIVTRYERRMRRRTIKQEDEIINEKTNCI